ncbi:hypothetical protein C8R44DRAFT_726347 [Mycena epipterygia]|nr:hypothetical protein C8R44DRAFT_726347 [Mycena epipterygia]
MDNIPPTSNDPPPPMALETVIPPAQSLAAMAMVSGIPATIPRPGYWVPTYDYNGLPFCDLPIDVQYFLTSHGLGNLTEYTAELVAPVRSFLADELQRTAEDVCINIAYCTIAYNILRAFYPPADPRLARLVAEVHTVLLPALAARVAAYLRFADALVWLDIAARAGGPDALTTENALRYRWLQTQPAIEQVNDRLVMLYAWTVSMWRLGWRTDGDAALYCIAPDPVYTVDTDVVADDAYVELSADADMDADDEYVELDADAAAVEPSDIVRPESPLRRPDTPIPRSSVEPEATRVQPALTPLSPRRSRIRQRTSTVPLCASAPMVALSPPRSRSRASARSPPPSPSPRRAKNNWSLHKAKSWTLPSRGSPSLWKAELSRLADAV